MRHLNGWEICTRAGGVDHRITVSVALNQGVGFYLGCPKSAHILMTTAMHWEGNENTDNDQKAILSLGHWGLFFLVGGNNNKQQLRIEHKKLETPSTITVICIEIKTPEENQPKLVALVLREAVFTTFAPNVASLA